jgi:hypothetical protein
VLVDGLLNTKNMEIKKVTEEELFDILEKNTQGVYYYLNELDRYYCYLVTKNKKKSNIWGVKEYAFEWMNSVLRTHFSQTTS